MKEGKIYLVGNFENLKGLLEKKRKGGFKSGKYLIAVEDCLRKAKCFQHIYAY